MQQTKGTLIQRAAGALAAIALGLFVGWATHTWRKKPTAPPTAPELAQPAQQRPRPTWNASATEIVAKYNAQATKIDARLTLPAVSMFERISVDAPGVTFYTLRHEVLPNVWMLMEIDRASDRPFSLAVWGASNPDDMDHNIMLIAAMTTVGATIFGPGDDASVLVRLCGTLGDKSGKSSNRLALRGLEAYCGMTGGLWMSGVTVPKPPAL